MIAKPIYHIIFLYMSSLSQSTSILLAGALIALAIIFGPMIRENGPETPAQPTENVVITPEPSPSVEQDLGATRVPVPELDADEHVQGAKKPTFTIVEYSDLDCPFCADIHPTLEKLVAGRNDVAWSYRHFPLESIHPDARRKAQVSECIARTSSEKDAFWSYVSDVFAGAFDATYATYGTTKEAVTECLASPEIDRAVQDDIERALASGGRGTPYTVIANDTEAFGLSGALPLEIFEAILAELAS